MIQPGYSRVTQHGAFTAQYALSTRVRVQVYRILTNLPECTAIISVDIAEDET